MRQRFALPLLLVVQMLLSVSIVIGFAFLSPGIDDDPTAALYLTTGAPTLALIVVGIALAPAMLAQQKMQGVLDFQRSLPVPRTATLAADSTVWVGIAMPGVVAGLWVAILRFDLDLQVSPLVVPALLLVAMTNLSIGYGIAYLVPGLMVQVVTNLLLFLALLFSPVNFPGDRLPGWLESVHEVLPFASMAQAIRETLAVPADGISAQPFVVLGIWCAFGLTVSQWIMNRRG
jgi:ABC-2 type transport system permease protein